MKKKFKPGINVKNEYPDSFQEAGLLLSDREGITPLSRGVQILKVCFA